jgi:hypothetical protein
LHISSEPNTEIKFHIPQEAAQISLYRICYEQKPHVDLHKESKSDKEEMAFCVHSFGNVLDVKKMKNLPTFQRICLHNLKGKVFHKEM